MPASELVLRPFLPLLQYSFLFLPLVLLADKFFRAFHRAERAGAQRDRREAHRVKRAGANESNFPQSNVLQTAPARRNSLIAPTAATIGQAEIGRAHV